MMIYINTGYYSVYLFIILYPLTKQNKVLSKIKYLTIFNEAKVVDFFNRYYKD